MTKSDKFSEVIFAQTSKDFIDKISQKHLTDDDDRLFAGFNHLKAIFTM
jgi:hypothetical protein